MHYNLSIQNNVINKLKWFNINSGNFLCDTRDQCWNSHDIKYLPFSEKNDFKEKNKWIYNHWKWYAILYMIFDTSNRSSIHQLKFCKSFSLNMGVLPRPSGFSPSDLKFHILYFNPHKKKINFPNDHIFQMIPAKISPGQITKNFFNSHIILLCY